MRVCFHIDQTFVAVIYKKKMKKVPKHIKLILNETETIFLLDISSSIVPKDTEEGKAAEEDNQLYQQLTEEKQRTRKVASIGIQTISILKKTRATEPVQYAFQSNSTFASNWEMYDTYKAQQSSDGLDKHQEESDSENHKLIEEVSAEEFRKTKEQKDVENLSLNERFFDAALVIERLLANNCYNEQQKEFKGLLEENDSEKLLKYNYKLDLLWTFANEDTKNRCVTGLSFNTLTEDILAVGYGKYYFIDRKSTGAVMVWNIKNPKQPERQYFFQHPVTSLAFSKLSPNLLAVGFYNGTIKILDVSQREMKLRGEDIVAFEPVWDLAWLEQDKQEYFLACFGDGRVCKYRIFEKDPQMERVEITRTHKVEGRLKGMGGLRMFEGNEMSSSRHAPAVCLSLHSTNPSVFLLGTSEGVVHRCSVSYSTRHLGMFKAHEGTIHTVKFSPFVNKVYVTCGDDFQARLWLEGIDEPLLTSRYCMEPVLNVDWSPSHSTIMVSLRGMDIFIWDLQRKIHLPQSQTKSPTNSKNTLCRFTACGRCLIVGDVDGNVHVFSVNDLPMPAFFQENLFFQSVKTLLVTNADLVSKLEKLAIKRS